MNKGRSKLVSKHLWIGGLSGLCTTTEVWTVLWTEVMVLVDESGPTLMVHYNRRSTV